MLSTGGLLRACILLATVVGAFAAALVVGSGGMDKLVPHHAAVQAGGLQFRYPEQWSRMSAAQLPATATGSTAGEVVAGLCPKGRNGVKGGNGEKGRNGVKGGKGACAAKVDLAYVLFEQQSALPPLPAIEASLDATLPRSFSRFQKVDAAVRSTAGGLRYVRYEFRFVKGGQPRTGMVAAYRSEETGLMVVASGPADGFDQHRRDIVKILDGASAGH